MAVRAGDGTFSLASVFVDQPIIKHHAPFLPYCAFVRALSTLMALNSLNQVRKYQGELLAIGQLAWPVSCRSIRLAFLAAHGRDVCDCVDARMTHVSTSRTAGAP